MPVEQAPHYLTSYYLTFPSPLVGEGAAVLEPDGESYGCGWGVNPVQDCFGLSWLFPRNDVGSVDLLQDWNHLPPQWRETCRNVGQVLYSLSLSHRFLYILFSCQMLVIVGFHPTYSFIITVTNNSSWSLGHLVTWSLQNIHSLFTTKPLFML